MKSSTRLLCAVFGVLCLTSLANADDATTKPSIIAVNDKTTMEANYDQQVTVEGTIDKASWSRSGKVMLMTYKDATDSGFTSVVFEKSKERFDAAFGGDAAKTLSGAKVRVKGKLIKYASKTDGDKGKPEIVLATTDQITVLEAAATKTAE